MFSFMRFFSSALFEETLIFVTSLAALHITLKGLVFGGDKKAETKYKHKTKLNNK